MTARTRFLPLLLVAILAAGCAAASTASPEVSPEPSPSEEPEASKPQGSAPVEPTPMPCVPGFVCQGELAPGEYTSTSTGVTITFTLSSEGWSGLEDTTPGDGFALFNTAATAVHGIAVVLYSGEVFSGVCSPEPVETIGSSAADFIAFLAAVEGVEAGAPVDTTVGGLPAIQLDLTTDSPCTDPDRMWLWTLPVHGDFHFNDGEWVRVYAIDAGNVTLVMVIEAFREADYEALLLKADEILSTMVISPGS